MGKNRKKKNGKKGNKKKNIPKVVVKQKVVQLVQPEKKEPGLLEKLGDWLKKAVA